MISALVLGCNLTTWKQFLTKEAGEDELQKEGDEEQDLKEEKIPAGYEFWELTLT